MCFLNSILELKIVSIFICLAQTGVGGGVGVDSSTELLPGSDSLLPGSDLATCGNILTPSGQQYSQTGLGITFHVNVGLKSQVVLKVNVVNDSQLLLSHVSSLLVKPTDLKPCLCFHNLISCGSYFNLGSIQNFIGCRWAPRNYFLRVLSKSVEWLMRNFANWQAEFILIFKRKFLNTDLV